MSHDEHLHARIHGTIECPKCGREMKIADRYKLIHCMNRACPIYDKAFEIPTVTLIPKGTA